MSLNSSSVRPLEEKPKDQKDFENTPINDGEFNKSRSGFISSILNDKPIEMRI